MEDRRQNVMCKMNVLREKYMELKRICKSQNMEIKKLRTERVATLKMLDNDADHTFTENKELIKKYKSRISDLENKLKIEIKKNNNSKQLNCSDTSFRYKMLTKLYYEIMKFCNNQYVFVHCCLSVLSCFYFSVLFSKL